MKKLLAPIWTRLPFFLRRWVVRMSQSTFTVGVSAVLLNDSREVLLLRHRFRENPRWELPGGFVGHGEQLEAAITRELSEEAGYEIEILDLISVYCPRSSHLDVCFSARLRNGKLRLEEGEILDGRFFAADSLPREMDVDQRKSVEAALAKDREAGLDA